MNPKRTVSFVAAGIAVAMFATAGTAAATTKRDAYDRCIGTSTDARTWESCCKQVGGGWVVETWPNGTTKYCRFDDERHAAGSNERHGAPRLHRTVNSAGLTR